MDPDAALAPFASQIGPGLYISDPKPKDVDTSKRPLVFLGFWMNAPASQLARYIVEYRRMSPSSRIVFCRSTSNDLLFASGASSQSALLSPAVDALRLAGPSNPVFIHLFSNGGVHKCAHLLRTYKEATGEALTVSSMLFDSAPGVATVESGMKALSFQLPQNMILRLISKAGLWIFLNAMQIFGSLARIPNPMDVARAMINDKSLFNPSAKKGLIRCYIYSESDTLIKPHEVEDHIKDSEAAGIVVRREKFKDTPHITHMIMDPERYWSIVKKYYKPTKI